ncbi:JAB domain-containing protein [Sorangium cellulosum]|uniref:JAB domain-containing protein n=1 Tax=Sorangium cellulosum TaxID=56 RepID=UPI0009D6BB89|nr:JAB domain-containing protein [Sorangium cellulosum]
MPAGRGKAGPGAEHLAVPLGGELAAPEAELLRTILRSQRIADRLTRAPGGWRDLSEHELERLRLTKVQRRAVLALQQLVRNGYPSLPKHRFSCSADIARIYADRLGGLVYEVMLAIALNGRNEFMAELELARGGRHGAALTVADALRPVIRAGASAFVLVHNHPSGDPMPSPEDIALTTAMKTAADLVSIPLVDHIIIGGRGGGFSSMLDLCIIL